MVVHGGGIYKRLLVHSIGVGRDCMGEGIGMGIFVFINLSMVFMIVCMIIVIVCVHLRSSIVSIVMAMVTIAKIITSMSFQFVQRNCFSREWALQRPLTPLFHWKGDGWLNVI